MCTAHACASHVRTVVRQIFRLLSELYRPYSCTGFCALVSLRSAVHCMTHWRWLAFQAARENTKPPRSQDSPTKKKNHARGARPTDGNGRPKAADRECALHPLLGGLIPQPTRHAAVETYHAHQSCLTADMIVYQTREAGRAASPPVSLAVNVDTWLCILWRRGRVTWRGGSRRARSRACRRAAEEARTWQSRRSCSRRRRRPSSWSGTRRVWRRRPTRRG